MARSSTIPMSFPPFAGVVRKLVLWNVGVFFFLLVLGLATARCGRSAGEPATASAFGRGARRTMADCNLLFYSRRLVGDSVAMLTLWFCGSLLEGAYGGRWLKELYFTSAIGGAAVASVISFTHLLGSHRRAPPWERGRGSSV